MTTREAQEKGQVPTWGKWAADIKARQEKKEAFWYSIGYRPQPEHET